MTDRPRLLFVAPWFLFPANTGGRIRTRDILRGMKGGRFDITLLSPAPSAGAPNGADLDGVCDRFVGWPEAGRGPLFAYSRLRHLASPLPVSVADDRSPQAVRALRSELEHRPDLVVIDFAHTAVLAPGKLPAPSLLFTHNVEAEIFRRHAEVARNPLVRALWRNQHGKMIRFERAALHRFDGVVAVSEDDRSFFAETYGVSDVEVIPTGVDLDFFAAPDGGPARRNAPGSTVVFTGSMDWMPNIDGVEHFMDRTWPLIAGRCPEARFVVVGREPPRGLCQAAKDRGLPWRFTGRVDDVRPFVREAQVYVIPLRVGGGTRLKVFEAMAMGCPVVSTTIGVEGLPLEPDRHYLRADTPEDFAGAVVRLLGDGTLRERLAGEARAHVTKNFSSRIVARRFEEICVRVAGLDG